MHKDNILIAVGVIVILIIIFKIKHRKVDAPPTSNNTNDLPLKEVKGQTAVITMIDNGIEDPNALNSIEQDNNEREQKTNAEPVNALEMLNKEDEVLVNNLNEITITTKAIARTDDTDSDISKSGLVLQKTGTFDVMGTESDVHTYSPDMSLKITMTTNTNETPYGENLEWTANKSAFDTEENIPILARPASSGHVMKTPSEMTSDLHGIYNNVTEARFEKSIVESYGLTESSYSASDLRMPVDYSLIHKQSEQAPTNAPYVSKFTHGLEESMNFPVVEPRLLNYNRPRFVDCYADNPRDRALQNYLGVMSVENCGAEARQRGHNVFGLQYGEGVGGGMGECWAGDGVKYAKHGASSDCTLHGDNYLGGYSSNAVYMW